jgi:hypothetical protein
MPSPLVLTTLKPEVLAFTGFGAKTKGGDLPRTSTRTSIWTIHPKGVDY